MPHDQPSHGSNPAASLRAAAAAHPGHDIQRVTIHDQVCFVAIARSLSEHPYAVMTDTAGKLFAALDAGRDAPRPGPDGQDQP